MKKIIVTILAIATVSFGTILVLGQTGEGTTEGKPGMGRHGKHGEFGRRGFGGRHGGRGMMGGRLFKQLDLTDDQKAQVKAIHENSRTAMKPIMEQMRENRQKLQALSVDGTFDETQVQALAAQQGALTAQMIVEKERAKAAVHGVLTPEQKAKAAEMKAQFKEKMEARKARMAEKKADKQ